MKKYSVFAASVVFATGLCAGAGAAYPVYSGYNTANGYPMVNMPVQQPMPQQMYLPSQNSVVVATTNPGVVMQTRNAASPNRITGALPRVGSSATTAGRKYYQPSDYDRLADSGLYIGLGVAYTASVMGNMSAEYANEDQAFFAPGAFRAADFKSDTVIPLQLSVGAAINNDLRVDFSYLRYSGISYASTVQTADGSGGYVEAQVDGGAITVNAAMLNLYYNIDSYTGFWAGGMLRPYVGLGLGVSLNTIADYVVYDQSFYSEMDPSQADAGDITGVSDIYGYHNGGTTEQLAFALEGGVTTELDGGIKLDFFVRYANMGNVKTSGSIVVSQTEWFGDGSGQEFASDLDTVFHYTDWFESGRISMVDVGMRLRLQF